jgi:hypothetical protein
MGPRRHRMHAGNLAASLPGKCRLGGLLLLAWIVGLTSAFAETGWLEVQGRAPFRGADEGQARNQAIEDAHREAIYQALAKDISVEDLFVSLRLSGAIMGTIPCGRVTATKILAETVVSATASRGVAPLSEYRVKLAARVSECETEPATRFRLEANLNKAVYWSGDPVSLTLSATEDCYYYVFNILEDEKVLQLVPNRLNSDNRLLAGKTAVFPSRTDTGKGIHPIAHTPPKVSQTTEALYVIGLRRPVDFSSTGIQEGLFGQYDGHTAFIKALVRVVATVPVSQRAEQLIRYQIQAKTQ